MTEKNDRAERLAAFDTQSLLRAVDDLDLMRDYLDSVGHAPPEIRFDLLTLHKLAMRVINEGSLDRVAAKEMFDLAHDLESRIEDLSDALDRLRETIGALATLSPDE